MLCQDCKPAPTGVGLPAPEQECVATHTAWESFGSSVTLAQCLGRHTFFAQANTTGKGKDRNGSGGTPLAGEEFFDLPGFGFPATDDQFAVHHQGRGGHNPQLDDLHQIFYLLHIGFHPQIAQGLLGVFI